MRSFDQQALYVVWSPEGTRLAFIDEPDHDVWVASLTSGRTTRIASGGSSTRFLDWQAIPHEASAFKNRAAFCRAQLRALGATRFRATYGRHGKRADAFGACVRRHR